MTTNLSWYLSDYVLDLIRTYWFIVLNLFTYNDYNLAGKKASLIK